MYDSSAEAARRLQRCVIMYDGYPVYVNGCADDREGDICVAITPLPRMRDELTVKLNDPKLDFRNLPLGYVNGTYEAVYILRRPARQQQQGLCQGNIVPRQCRTTGRRITYETLLPMPTFADCMKGNYPTVEEAVAQLNEEDTTKISVAFHRRMAIEKEPRLGFYKLLYKGEEVAWGSKELFTLPTQFAHLREQLNELGVRAA